MSLTVYLIDSENADADYFYSANVTHNLTEMASEAGVYKAIWRPEEINAKYAKDIIEIVQNGLIELVAHPEIYTRFNPENGWGSYNGFIKFVAKYLKMLKEYPDALIEISR